MAAVARWIWPASESHYYERGIDFSVVGLFCEDEELFSYPTLHHYRDAANHRTSMKNSLKKFSSIFTVHSANRGEDDLSVDSADNAKSMPSPAGAFLPSPAVPIDEMEDMEEDKEPEAKGMPHATATMKNSPSARGKSIDNVSEKFKERCNECLGIWYAKMLEPDKPQDAQEDSDEEIDTSTKMVPKSSACHVCRRQTAFVCQGCRRHLCNIPPKVRKVKLKQKATKSQGKKKSRRKQKPKPKIITIRYPGRVYVDVPIFDEAGNPQGNKKGRPQYQTEYAENTCYLVAHRKFWKKHLFAAQAEGINKIKKAEKKHKLKKRKKKSKR